MTRFHHYYASPEMKRFDREQPNELELATSQITREMIVSLIGNHARGRTPYWLSVPKSLLYEAHEWRIPTTLLVIDPVNESDEDVSPVAMATLDLHGQTVFIHARRVLPVKLVTI